MPEVITTNGRQQQATLYGEPTAYGPVEDASRKVSDESTRRAYEKKFGSHKDNIYFLAGNFERLSNLKGPFNFSALAEETESGPRAYLSIDAVVQAAEFSQENMCLILQLFTQEFAQINLNFMPVLDKTKQKVNDDMTMLRKGTESVSKIDSQFVSFINRNIVFQNFLLRIRAIISQKFNNDPSIMAELNSLLLQTKRIEQQIVKNNLPESIQDTKKVLLTIALSQ